MFDLPEMMTLADQMRAALPALPHAHRKDQPAGRLLLPLPILPAGSPQLASGRPNRTA